MPIYTLSQTLAVALLAFVAGGCLGAGFVAWRVEEAMTRVIDSLEAQASATPLRTMLQFGTDIEEARP